MRSRTLRATALEARLSSSRNAPGSTSGEAMYRDRPPDWDANAVIKSSS